MKTLADGKIVLGYDEAVARLYVHEEVDEEGRATGRRTVHTFVESPFASIGADWDLDDVLTLLAEAEAREDEADRIRESGPFAQAINHGVAARKDDRGMVYFAAAGPKVPA